MALYKLVFRASMDGLAPADVCTWTHGVELPTLPDGPTLAGWMTSALLSTVEGAALRSHMPGSMARKSIELAPATGGESVVFEAMSGQLGIASGLSVPQAALPIIALVPGPRGLAAGARWMIGPVAASGSIKRPSTQMMNGALSYAKAMNDNLQSLGGYFVVLRDGGSTGEQVTHFSISNSFGIVSRRRLEVTARTQVTA